MSLEKIKGLLRRFVTWDQGLRDRGGRAISAETFPQVLFVLAVFGGAWAFAWYGDVIGPWMAQALGLGPYDIDSPGKIRWRRMYSTAFCAPVIIYATGHYCYSCWRKFAAK